jgi:hypothetical protein
VTKQERGIVLPTPPINSITAVMDKAKIGLGQFIRSNKTLCVAYVIVMGFGLLAVSKSSLKTFAILVIASIAIRLLIPLFRKLNRKIDKMGGIPAADEDLAEVPDRFATPDSFELRPPPKP